MDPREFTEKAELAAAKATAEAASATAAEMQAAKQQADEARRPRKWSLLSPVAEVQYVAIGDVAALVIDCLPPSLGDSGHGKRVKPASPVFVARMCEEAGGGSN